MNYNRRPEKIKRNFEYITIIWLDGNINKIDAYNQIKTFLCKLNHSVQYYTDPTLCFDYIKTVINEKILLIISGEFYEQFSSTIHSVHTIHMIFLFCDNRFKYMTVLNEYPNTVEIHTNETQLIESIDSNIHFVLERTLTFSLFNTNTQKTTRDFASAIWFQLLLDILKKLPHTDQAKNEMLNKCAEYYDQTSNEYQKINKFRYDYLASKAIEWYTAECFLYKLLNTALRSEDINLLYLFRFYIVDLCSQLEDEHRKQFQINQNENEFIVYRGQIIAFDELEKMIKNSGIQISINTFLSTSKNREAALAFVVDYKDNQQWKGVLFEIKIPSNLKSVIYADISELSYNRDEEEILFQLGTVFQILSVNYDDKELNIWKIKMIPIDNPYEHLEKFLNTKNNEMENYSSTIVFGRLLFYELGQTEKAKEFFEMLLQQLSNEHEDFPSVCHNLGSVYRRKGELNLALDYYSRAYHLRKQRYNENHPHIASSLRNIGLVYYAKHDYKLALKNLQKALKIEEINDPNIDNENKAVTMVRIGMVYKDMKEFILSLKYLLNGYDMYCQVLPAGHPDIGWTAVNIGCCYEDQEDYDRALDYYHKAYEINENVLSSEHEDLTSNLNKIINSYIKKGEYNIALIFCNTKLKQYRSLLDKNHPRIAYTLQTIANIYQNTNQFNEALDYYEQSLDIFKQYLPLDQEAIIQCLILKSELYFKYNKFQDALTIRLEVLTLQENFYSSEHINIAVSILFIGQLYKYDRNYSETLPYFDRCLKIYQANYKSEHDNVKFIINEIELIRKELN